MAEPQDSTLAARVAAARRHLGRTEVRHALVARAPWTIGAFALAAASRPLVWPLASGPEWTGALRALLLGGGVLVAGACGIAAAAWRRRPSLLQAARRVDHALGRPEVVASAFAFERDRRAEPGVVLAIERGREAIAGADLGAALDDLDRRERPTRPGAARRRYALAAALVLGLGAGSIDRVIAGRLLHPVTASERASAAELRKAAEVAASADRPGATPKKALEAAEAARRAAQAAERGDRQRAAEALADMRDKARAADGQARSRAESLRGLRDALEGKPAGEGPGAGAGKPGARPSADARASLLRMKEELERAGGDRAATERVLERLSRAEEAARRAAERDGAEAPSEAWAKAAAALAEARAAAARGDAAAAARALAAAEQPLDALERERGKGSALARLIEGGSALDRSILAGAAGKDEGADGAGGKGAEPGERGAGRAALLPAGGDPAAGSGPGRGDRALGLEQHRAKVGGDLQARADVREGDRAIKAIEGLGRGGDEAAYREIFPSYDSAAEDGLHEELVPAARRPAVRRYFSAIRPGGDTNDASKAKAKEGP